MSLPGGPNPYQQPSYGYPQQPGGYGPLVPSGPAPLSGRGGRMPGWLLGVGGVLVASAAWGGVLFATGVVGGSDEESPDLAGYRFEDDLCGAADLAVYEPDYRPQEDTSPVSESAVSEVLDIAGCDVSLVPADASYEDYYSVYVQYELTWHKGTDPAAEFAAEVLAYDQYSEGTGYYDYASEPVTGLGEEAFVVYGENATSEELGWAGLFVRDGWFEYALTWDAYLAEDSPLADRTRVRDMLVAATEDVLQALQGPEPGSV